MIGWLGSGREGTNRSVGVRAKCKRRQKKKSKKKSLSKRVILLKRKHGELFYFPVKMASLSFFSMRYPCSLSSLPR